MSPIRCLALLTPALLVAQIPSERELLSRPRALASEPAAATAAEVRRHFQDPPAQYRSMPLWVWNDSMQWPRAAEQLKQFREQGIGGVFIHPRPGLMTEYLGADWFRLWGQAMEEGKRLGLLVNIYDENSYPSGFAGGHVPSEAPDTVSQYVQVDLQANARSMAQQLSTTVAFFAVQRDSEGHVAVAQRVTDAAAIPEGFSLIAFRLKRASGNPWNGGFPYVDLTNPQTTPAFLRSTYDAYKQHFGAEFGKTIKWAFTDEPLLATAGSYDSAALSLPLSYNTLAEFRNRNGYDLADAIASLFWDVGEFRKVRFDYWQTLHDLWKENFMRPMFEWNDRNNLQFTGHWMEHEWPYPWITPADASLYAFEHVPGIDMLEGTNIRTTGKDPHMLFTIRQVSSVAHQLGRRAFTEAYGVAGWDSTFEHYKRFGDWLMVNGINFLDQHLAFSTVRGARKRDHPQSFTDVSPWWPYYRLHADHLARVSYLSSRSESRNRVVVLEQTTSGFLFARRGSSTPELEEMRAHNAEMNQLLSDHQVDYDLGDEYMIEWFGGQDGRRFVIGRRAYDLVVIPPDMVNVRKQTVPALERYLAAGGEIVSLSEVPPYVDGRPNPAVQDLANRYPHQWHRAGNLADLVPAIRQRIRPRVAFDNDMPQVGVLERWFADGSRMLFLANTGLEKRSARATVAGASVEEWNSVTGGMMRLASNGGGTVMFDVELPPAGSALYIVSDAAAATPAGGTQREWTRIATGDWRIKADSPNILALDYCDLRAGGETRTNLNTWRANWNVWQTHGFERPAWDNAVQYKTRVFDRNHFAKESGFEATFRFEVASEAALNGLELAVESPELYKIAVNGQAIDFGSARRWLDPHIQSAPISKVVRRGQNTVTITAAPFDVRMELENIYLRGNFNVGAADAGFRIASPQPLAFGSWASQGYTFYSDAVTYSTEVDIPANAPSVRVELPDLPGSVAAVLLDGQQVGVIGWQPLRAEFPAAPGRHTVAVRIVSTPRNTFGPFHNPSKPRMRAWPAAWAEFPEHQPPGSAYDFIDYGLKSAPAVFAGNAPVAAPRSAP